MFKRLNKPEYFFNLRRILSRVNYLLFPPSNSTQKIQLIWGRSIVANPQQTIGRSLYSFGLYDLPLSEMILRLVRPGDLVLDIGANIGYTTCLMLDCLEGRGELMTFEPLPTLFNILSENTESMGMEIAQLYKMALSDKSGEAVLTLPSDFNNNDGVATLQEIGDGKKISVQTSTLDSLDLKRQVRLMKIDVEGHELSVLKGAEESFKKNLFEYILFEELSGYKNSQTAKFLEDRGYKILKLVKSFNGLMLVAPELEVNNSYEPDNFLATKDSTIFEKINHKPEWKIFAWKPKTK